MAENIHTLVAAMSAELQAASFKDYCPNGLQVEGRSEVATMMTAVTASQNAVDAAVAAGVELLLVHHGYFWRGEAAPVVGMKRRRLQALLTADINLVAYHLPLDAHPLLGNNARLGLMMGVVESSYLAETDRALGMQGLLAKPVATAAFRKQLMQLLGRDVIHVGPSGRLRKIAWCTGAGQRFIEDAAAAGADAFVSGEISEPTAHSARELGIQYFAAGHHATERYGVQALGQWLAERYGLAWEFFDDDNPA